MVTKRKTKRKTRRVARKPAAKVQYCECHGNFPVGAFFFLFVGILWLAKNRGWFSADFWPTLFIVIGLVLFLKFILRRK